MRMSHSVKAVITPACVLEFLPTIITLSERIRQPDSLRYQIIANLVRKALLRFWKTPRRYRT